MTTNTLLSVSEISSETINGALKKGELLREKRFSLADAGIDSKLFSSWKAKGLAGFIEKQKWTKVSFIELLWIKTLQSMYNLGCSFELMKNVYDYFFTRAFEENLAAKNLKENLVYYKTLATQRPLTEEEEIMLSQLELFHQDKKIIESLRTEISHFYLLVLECFKYRAESGLIIFENKTFTSFVNDPARVKSGAKVAELNVPHIYIPISSFIIDFITDEEKADFLVPCGILDEDEMRILRELRNKNIRSLKISFREKDHAIEKIESDKYGIISGAKAREIMAILGLKNYMGIELNTRDGKTLSFKRTEKEFL